MTREDWLRVKHITAAALEQLRCVPRPWSERTEPEEGRPAREI